VVPIDDLGSDDPDVLDADPDGGLHESTDRILV